MFFLELVTVITVQVRLYDFEPLIPRCYALAEVSFFGSASGPRSSLTAALV